ncbi:hypothetical protein [Methylobacterium sp. WL8]|uniref:hypothetical protein n=1 Tax=Methylobacterium sp. WL8 TaxID=2603899 RepID=UPI0011C9F928|nr:hypothetical protein [Methylobacterium sp. WL8]TXN82693.1 hypothetical protein FV234_09120 [Methylobacterium sp. WL8]
MIMAQAARQTLTDFADELYLTYLQLHSVWGCPGRIPLEARAWTPPPTPALITDAAARGFQDWIEDAACTTALTEKRGGITYACAVRGLYDAITSALLTAAHPGPVDVCGWAFDLAWSGDLWIIDAPRPKSSPRSPTDGAESGRAPARRARAVPRREVLGLFAAVPSALTLGTGRAFAHPTTHPAWAVASAVALEARPHTVLATVLRVLDSLPWADRWTHITSEKTHCALERLRELDTGPFVSAATLVRGLAETLTADSCPRCRTAVSRDVARAETADHVRFHAATADLLLARLRRYAAAGTTWYGQEQGAPMSWDGLVTSATFDLWNFCASLRMRDECVVQAADPLTFTDEIQVALGPLLVRLQRGNTRLIGPALCAWVPPGLGAAAGDRRALSHIWLLDDVEGPLS